MIKPNLFIVGAAKAGTTSLYQYLMQHPDVFMSPIKEPHYLCKDIRSKEFSKSYRKSYYFDINEYLKQNSLSKKHIAFIEHEEDYLQLFRDVKNEKLVGEISTGYLYSQCAAKEIYKFNNKAKIVIVLRDPIERAFSHWMMDLRGNDVCRSSFMDAIKEDQAKMDKGWGRNHLYVELGLYYEQTKRYLESFQKKHVLVMLYDELKNDPESFFHEFFAFLEIKPVNIDPDKRYNEARLPKYPLVNSIIGKLKLNQLAEKLFSKESKEKMKNILFQSDGLPKLTHDDRDQMKSYFEDDIQRLQILLGRDLSAWLR